MNKKFTDALDQMMGKSLQFEFNYPVNNQTNGWWLIIIFLIGMAVEIFRVFVFATLWNWFIVPVFGLPKLTTLLAMGILLPLSLITSNSDNGKGQPLEYLLTILFNVVLALVFGIIIKWLVGL